MPESLGSAVLELFVDDENLRKGLKKAQKFGKEAGETFTKTGQALTLGVTAPLLALGGISAKAAIDFESAFTGVQKTVTATEAEFAELREGILEMSAELPASANEIAKVGEAAGQLGIETKNIKAFTKVMIDLGETTNLTADQAATSLARLANITQLPQTEFQRLGSVIVELGNNMATTEAEIVEFGLRIAGAGKQVGLSEAQILAFGAALSSVGLNAEAGGTAISRVFLEMQKSVAEGGSELEKFAKVAGVGIRDFKELFERDAAGAMVKFVEGLNRIKVEGGNVTGVLADLGFGNIRVRDALLRASGAGDLLRQSLKLGTEEWKTNTALTKEAELRYRTTASQLAIMKNQLTRIAIEIGSVLLPILTRFIAQAQPVIDIALGWARAFGEASPAVQTTVLVIAGLAAALGPALIIIGQVTIAVTAMIPAFVAVGTAIATFAAGATATLTAFGAFVVTNMALIAGATGIGLVIAAIALWVLNWEQLKTDTITILTFMIEQIRFLFDTMLGFIGEKMATLKENLIGPWRDAFNVLVGNSIIPDLVNKVRDLFETMKGDVKTKAKQTADGIKASFAGMVVDVVKNVGKMGAALAKGEISFKTFADAAVKALLRIAAQRAAFAIGSALGGPLGGIVAQSFAGAFADGGFIGPGQFGLVGEEGPELAFGGRTGLNIQPQAATAGGPGIVINNTNIIEGMDFSSQDVVGPVLDKIGQVIREGARDAIGFTTAVGESDRFNQGRSA